MHEMAISSTSTRAVSAEAPIERRWVAKLFERLGGQLGTKVADLYAGVKAEVVQAEWSQGLAGFTGLEIARGVAACSERKFAPTLGEFKQFCRPALDPEYAWHEAVAGLQARDRGEVGVWSHPAVWRASSAMGHEVRTGSFAAVRKRWEWTLSRELSAGWGEEVPPPVPQIEHKPTLRAIPSDIREQLAGLSRQFNSRKG